MTPGALFPYCASVLLLDPIAHVLLMLFLTRASWPTSTLFTMDVSHFQISTHY